MAGYDYIVVGAGSAGCIVAARLAADPAIKVLLLEAGPRNKGILFSMPAGVAGTAMKKGPSNWFFETEPEPFLDGRRLDCPRGRGLGGSSAINGMLYLRGTPADYDQWRQMGLRGWGYDDVLPFFRKMENHVDGESTYHGADGPIRISHAADDNPFYDAFIEAGRQAGLKPVIDFNGADQEGVGRFDWNIWNGRRSAPASTYLAEPRANLEIRTDAHVTRLVIDRQRVVGVEYASDRGGARQIVRADRETVLAAGAIQTPHILQISGVGDPDRLAAAGIATVHELKGVGANLQDHLDVPVSYDCAESASIASRMRGIGPIKVALRYLVSKSGLAAQGVTQVGFFARSRPELDRPDLQCIVFAAALENGKLMNGFTLRIAQLNPASRGRLDARSADPFEPPRIQFNYLSAESDRIALRRAVGMARTVVSQPALDPYRRREMSPGADVQEDEAIDAHVRREANSDYHPVGTCRMGIAGNPMTVVDDQLGVIGLAGLRIADASVMPVIVSGNTNAAAMMIGERCAHLIRHGDGDATAEAA